MLHRWTAAWVGGAIAATTLVGVTGCARPARPNQMISLDLSGPRPVALLKVGTHRPVKAIFDSGAGATIVNAHFARELGLPDQGDIDVGSPGASAPVKGTITSISPARLGNAEIDDGRGISMNFPPTIEEYSSIVSPNAFRGRLIRFEFSKGRAIVMDKTAATIPRDNAAAYGGEDVHPLPAAEIEVAGRKLIAHLDSGSKYGLNLPLSLAKHLPLKGPLVAHEAVHMVGGKHKAYAARIDGVVRIGPLSLKDPQVLFLEGVPPIGNVGIQVLKQLTLVLDPEEMRAWLLKR